MTVEFVGMIGAGYVSEAKGRQGAPVDVSYLRRFARVYDEYGFDWTLVPYSSAAPESNQLAAAVLAQTERLKVMLAHRPGVLHPTNAARAFATLDQLSGGRLGIHIIAGGSEAEQHREGDYLSKEDRYRRAGEYVRILKNVWTSVEPISHLGDFYQFESYDPGVRPVRGGIPVSIGGSSEAAYRLGGAEGDVFGLWGEPLAETRQQIESVNAYAEAAGRPHPRIWVSFRPIIAPTDDLAWRRAREILGGIQRNFASNGRAQAAKPENVGSQRLLAVAERGEVHDRALWTAPAAATNAAGSSTALVGSPETVAQALLDYVDIGCELLSIRGYDPLDDALDLGRYVLPLVREELAKRERQSV
ncbi:MAG TPA: LLM class flavin-dependent oxidoreductase [Amycolatopsis sp.]|uniref:LLM class flavin-dependent oxidoreductase n=1 Tax=Amycolatopsis sp. TaxID=37632 RepID=UPI002B49FEB6|nr:LLM class flavin-dependent oxidoreductase [Amycolatopsis sp.]HKS47347.1 LLM class flavin-dependent oxidoreductase [Amycolatopsis sp.]